MTKKFKPKSSSYWLEYNNGLLLVYFHKTGVKDRFINLSKVKYTSINYDKLDGTLDMCMSNGYDVYMEVIDESEYAELSKYLFDCLKEANTVRTTTISTVTQMCHRRSRNG